MGTRPGGTILQRVAAAEPGSVERCLEAYGPLVWALARRSGLARPDAEDLVQDVFIALWRFAGRYDPARGAEPTFVAAVARRRLIDRFRRRRREGRSLEDLAEPPACPPDPGPALRDDAARVAAVLEELDPRQRLVVRLAVHDGFTHREVAERLRIPLGTVKSTLRRALVAARARLATSGALPARVEA